MHNPSNHAATLPHLAYRRDIDGLRAVAGVDVFFVISGYLISRILFGGMARGHLAFAEFYRRRIRRIFPALVVVLLATACAGWVLLTPGDYRQLGKHIVGGAAFVSNLVLWRESGYFDAAAELKPLLHLWSLGVEEQFYIAWPIALWVAWRARLHRAVVLGSLVAASFALNLWMARHDPTGDFYSPLSRFWELGSGALLAHASMRARAPMTELAA